MGKPLQATAFGLALAALCLWLWHGSRRPAASRRPPTRTPVVQAGYVERLPPVPLTPPANRPLEARQRPEVERLPQVEGERRAVASPADPSSANASNTNASNTNSSYTNSSPADSSPAWPSPAAPAAAPASGPPVWRSASSRGVMKAPPGGPPRRDGGNSPGGNSPGGNSAAANTRAATGRPPANELPPPRDPPLSLDPPPSLEPPLSLDSPQGEPSSTAPAPGPAATPRRVYDDPLRGALATAEQLRDYRPWWQEAVTRPLAPHQAVSIAPEPLILSALRFSPHIAMISTLPQLRCAEVDEAAAAFDTTLFVESSFEDLNVPVGNTLTTGGPPRLLDHTIDHRTGVRRRTDTGARVELSQDLGFHNSNSAFFIPNNQGNARLALNFSQPLLNGAGRQYNRSQIVIAQLGADMAWNQVERELQGQMLKVFEAYWEVYLQRSLLLQRQRSYERASDIFKLLTARREFDAVDAQIARARAAATARRLDIIRSQRDVRHSETDLRNLIQDPALASTLLELVPIEPPARLPPQVDMRSSVVTALRSRPEINQKMREVRSAAVERDVAKNELLPVLNLVVSGYLSGLEGRSDIPQAFTNQFSEGGPTYSAGMVFERPFGNRAAKARLRRSELQIRMLGAQLQVTLGDVGSEVEKAVRDVVTAYEQMRGALASLHAAQIEVDAIEQQWRLLPGDNRTTSAMLDELLDAQQRMTQEESLFARAETEYATSLIRLRKAEGTLLQHQRITPEQVCSEPPGVVSR